MTLEKLHEITSALKRGAEVKIKVKGSKTYSILQLNYMLPEHDSKALYEYANEEIELKITEPQEPRLPTIDEVFQWFKEGKIFKSKKEPEYAKISVVSKDFKRINLVLLYGEWQSIKELVANFTDENGESLMVVDK